MNMILYALTCSVHFTVASLLETNLLCIFIHWKYKMANYLLNTRLENMYSKLTVTFLEV